MNKKILGLYFLIVTMLFAASWLLIETDININIKKWAILFICGSKTILFMVNVIKKEIDFFKNDLDRDIQEYLLIISSVLLIICSYSFDYFLIYKINLSCFSPLLENASNLKIYWNSFYYSSMIFFWMGIADINTNCTLGQFITWSESMVTFFILSYGSFKFLKNQ